MPDQKTSVEVRGGGGLSRRLWRVGRVPLAYVAGVLAFAEGLRLLQDLLGFPSTELIVGFLALGAVGFPVVLWWAWKESRYPAAPDDSRSVESTAGRIAQRAPAPPRQFSANPHTVGRDESLLQLKSVLTAVTGGSGQMVCVTGEAGIGKTTVVETFLGDISAGGSDLVLARGQCSERLAGAEAYLPILEMLEDLAREAGILKALWELAPTWANRLGPQFRLGEEEVADGAFSQEKLKRELASFLQAVGRERTPVLLLEDLHWADISTVDLLRYLADRFGQIPALVLATYRPEDMRVSRHPFLEVKSHLQTRGVLREVSLDFLNKEHIALYLGLEYPGHAFPEGIAESLHRRTEGSPLFLAGLLRELEERGSIVEGEAGWTLAEAAEELEDLGSGSLDGLIQAKIDRLDARDRELLNAAAVLGYEFLTPVLADALDEEPEEVEAQLTDLYQIHGLLRPLGEEETPKGSVGLRYQFVHALYQNALHEALPPALRVSLSRTSAEALIGHFGEGPSEVVAEVANLLEEGRDFEASVGFYLLAAREAAALFANREVVASAERGMDLIQKLPETPARDRLELDLEMIRGPSFLVLRGFGAPETERCYKRAEALVAQLGDPADRVPVLAGLFFFHAISGHLKSGMQFAEEAMRMGEEDPSLLLPACQILGSGQCWSGDFVSAEQTFKKGLEAFREEDVGDFLDHLPQDPGLACHWFYGICLFFQGRFEEGLRWGERGYDLAKGLGHPGTLMEALVFRTYWHLEAHRGEEGLSWARELTAFAEEEGFPDRIAMAKCYTGRALCLLGQVSEGISLLEEGTEAMRAQWELLIGSFDGWLAWALAVDGRSEEALELVDSALVANRRKGEGLYDSDLWRERGEVLKRMPSSLAGAEVTTLAGPTGDWPNTAEGCFERALQEARVRKAPYLELKAAMSLARFWKETGVGKKGLALLGTVYSGFEENMDWPVLVSARNLLEDLRASAS